ncbi:ribosome maturation factor RimP [Oxynema aestuarii]|jgi:ribosome maturation factor RimP|uniref:Ribosome maturation factor RimP n=1 Tax=Oxynema aestuarii AP17 TaxID=2064643 RepID=A0A6H1U2K2_9CYAN|nr:ribosome maturation factor RimP [Oxynema aestuarii]QIZ73108.1 ribosome maturation factor RimP [Oxynema aestuarii AP17]RMH75461.1 MAG: ribosome maturation factor RimP [Cyanobacteria bacterium J007]
MTHPLIPQIIELATPVAEQLGLEVVTAVFHTHESPPILRVDIRNPASDTSLDDCERMSKALDTLLDESDLIPDAYILEISSPGISSELSSDRDFVAFKGFGVTVATAEPFQGHQEWSGKLVRRDEGAVYLNQKGRVMKIPRSIVTQVRLADGV